MTETCCLFRHFPLDSVYCILLSQDTENAIYRHVPIEFYPIIPTKIEFYPFIPEKRWHPRQHVSVISKSPVRTLRMLFIVM